MVIMFKNERVREFLRRKRVVYTLRPKRRKEGKDWANSGWGTKKFAEVEITFIKKITKENVSELEKYVDYSGFKSVEEWLEEARKLNGDFPYYLYKVRAISINRAKELEPYGCKYAKTFVDKYAPDSFIIYGECEKHGIIVLNYELWKVCEKFGKKCYEPKFKGVKNGV